MPPAPPLTEAQLAAVEKQRALLRSLPSHEYQVLQDLCESNGISEDQLLHKSGDVHTIEMFLFNFPKCFSNLTTLCVMQQTIDKLDGFTACKNLENMWVTETQVDRIQGLEENLMLKNLYLYSNNIKKIENLAHLTRLERLWLADNEIPRIEGLETLTNLTELNLARNKVERVGDVFKSNPRLTSLNLSDNGVGSFKEVSYLARLPSLTDLSLSDPHWGENPITSLCNYQTYVLFNIQQLTALDTLALAEETKQLAEATYMKKRMYYNMRIKTLRRNTTNALRIAQEGSNTKVDKANLQLSTLVRHLKEVEREIEELKFYERAGAAGDHLKKLETKYEQLKVAVRRKTHDAAEMEQLFSDCCQRTYDLSDQYVRRLLVELETGGNIRMEDGRPTDLWYKSCVDLLHSRFFKEDFAAADVTGIRVVRVTRIHNRFLRNRFEEHLENMVDVSDPTYKRSLEYLFFGENPDMPGELARVPEDGFRHPHEYAALTNDGAVCLSNSVSLSDLPRLTMRQEAARKGQGARSRQWATGQLLVTKVFLGKSVQEMNLVQARRLMKEKDVAANGDPNQARILPEMYPDHNSVFRLKPTDPKQRTWFVFNHALVLPEYLVEFEYDIKPTSSVADSSVLQNLSIPITDPRATAELEALEFDIRPISRPIVPFLVYAAEEARASAVPGGCAAAAAAGDGAAAAEGRGKFPGFVDSGRDPVEEQFLAPLRMDPKPASRTQVFVLSEELILKQTMQQNLFNVTYLNLHSNGLRKLEYLAQLVNLRVLVASFNEISKIEGVSDLRKLERLELGYNQIKRIEGLHGLNALTHLELNNNAIYRLEDINVLKKYTPGLYTLNLRNNQICDNKTYKGLVLRRLTLLTALDGSPVTAEDHAHAAENSSTLTIQLIRDNSFCQRRTMWSIAGMGSKAGEKVQAGVDDDDWWESVEEMVLEHQRVRRLQNLERLTKMRRASFCDNELTRVEGLELCTSLEELSLEDNRITHVEGLSTLTNLKTLDLGKNKIAKIEGLEMLTWLTQLSIEDNEITSLAGLSALSCLMELYIGNNKLTALREVQHLREMPKLIILDLLGNPLCQTADYRLYVVYYMRKLKVLDGIGIEAAEQAAAKSKYAGKLTLDFLEERVGHRFFEHLRELDLSGFRIRDLGKVFYSDDFACLREVNLDNNFVSDISSLACLSNLCALRLNHNRLENNPIFREEEVIAALEEKAGESQLDPHAKLPCYDSLEVLQLGHNGISSLPSLHLHRLKYTLKILFLQDNDLTKVEGLESLVNLQELVLDRNKIKFVDTNSFSGLIHLQELRMEENGLRSLNNLHSLRHLKCLHLGMNRIVEVAELEKLAAHTELIEITLGNSPVSRKQAYRPMLVKKIPTLRLIDGHEVTVEERDHVELMFAPSEVMQSVSAQYVTAPEVSARALGGKVPVKLTSMNFESLIVPQGGAAANPFGAAGALMADAQAELMARRNLQHGRGGAGPSVGGGMRPGSGNGGPGHIRPNSHDREGKHNIVGGASHTAASSNRNRTTSILRNYYRHSGAGT